MCFKIEHLVNTKVFTEKNESHPIYLQPTAREEDGRGCWGITLMKTAKLRQGVCSGGRREGSRPPHPSRGLWRGACCNEKHDKGDNKSFLIKWLSHILISAHKKEMRGLCGSHRVSLMWFFFSSSVFHCGLLWLCFWHGVSFFFFPLRDTTDILETFHSFSTPRRMTLPQQNGASSSHSSVSVWPKYSPSSSKDYHKRFR